MRNTNCMFIVALVCSTALVGCSSSKKAEEEARLAREELAKVRAERDAIRNELAQVKAKPTDDLRSSKPATELLERADQSQSETPAAALNAIVHYEDGHTLRILAPEITYKFGASKSRSGSMGISFYTPNVVTTGRLHVTDTRGDISTPYSRAFRDVDSINWEYTMEERPTAIGNTGRTENNYMLKQRAYVVLRDGTRLDSPQLNYAAMTDEPHVFQTTNNFHASVDGGGKFSTRLILDADFWRDQKNFDTGASFYGPNAKEESETWWEQHRSRLIRKISFDAN